MKATEQQIWALRLANLLLRSWAKGRLGPRVLILRSSPKLKKEALKLATRLQTEADLLKACPTCGVGPLTPIVIQRSSSS